MKYPGKLALTLAIFIFLFIGCSSYDGTSLIQADSSQMFDSLVVSNQVYGDDFVADEFDIQGSQYQKISSTKYGFKFICPTDFQVKLVDREMYLETNELVYVDINSGTLVGYENQSMGFYQVRPQMGIAVHDLGDDFEVEDKIGANFADGNSLMVTYGNNNYFQQEHHGLVPVISYYLVKNDKLFHFYIKSWPTSINNSVLNQQVSQGLLMVLQTFDVVGG